MDTNTQADRQMYFFHNPINGVQTHSVIWTLFCCHKGVELIPYLIQIGR